MRGADRLRPALVAVTEDRQEVRVEVISAALTEVASHEIKKLPDTSSACCGGSAECRGRSARRRSSPVAKPRATFDVPERHVGPAHELLDRGPHRSAASTLANPVQRARRAAAIVEILPQDDGGSPPSGRRRCRAGPGGGYPPAARSRCAWVDHDHRARRAVLDVLPACHARWGCHGPGTVRADEEDVVRVLDVLRGVAPLIAEEAPVDPEVPSLLRERVVGRSGSSSPSGAAGRTHRRGDCPARRHRRTRTRHRRARRGAPGASRRSHRSAVSQDTGHERPVGLATERALEAIGVVLIVRVSLAAF